MSTKIDLCNLALAVLGEPGEITSIEPPEGDHAGHCARFFPIAVRRMFEAGDWSFATRIERPSELSLDTKDADWLHAFQVPSFCVRLIRVTDERGNDLDYEVISLERDKARVLLCNCPKPIIRYVAMIDEVAQWPGYFAQAAMLLLATYIVGPVKRQELTSNIVAGLNQQFEQALAAAKTADARMSKRVISTERIGSNQMAREI